MLNIPILWYISNTFTLCIAAVAYWYSLISRLSCMQFTVSFCRQIYCKPTGGLGTRLALTHVDVYILWIINNICYCSCCSSGITADKFGEHLTETLEEIRRKIPRVFVNLVPMANLSQVYLCVVIWMHAVVCTNISVGGDCRVSTISPHRSYTSSQLSNLNTVWTSAVFHVSVPLYQEQQEKDSG